MTEAAVATKQIRIVTIGEEPPREEDVTIEPRITTSDILEQADFLGYRLLRPDGSPYELAEELFDKVASGQKIYAARVDDYDHGR
ncbi:hypothetical protein BH23CHL2_BH23CHL2_19750 [soil metagenome]